MAVPTSVPTTHTKTTNWIAAYSISDQFYKRKNTELFYCYESLIVSIDIVFYD